GGVNLETISKAKQAGADTFVAGSVVFNSPDPAGRCMPLQILNVLPSADH
ncbi:MAG: hypothetical protein EBX09_06520, partial [Actinobacteria bacterium]|nr:hypothetical protein [Actinomycetota bacterium]